MSLTSSNVSVSVTTRVMTVTDLLAVIPFRLLTAVHYLLSLRCKILRDFVRIYVFKKGP